jgi:hypothetical protein
MPGVFLKADPNQGINVTYISMASTTAFEEWKHPGKYSPVMAFDGDRSTCFAEDESDNSFDFGIRFEKDIQIDEVRIMNGNGKSEDLFKKNNRVIELKVVFYYDKKELGEEIIKLKDQMEFQKLKLKKDYKADYIYVYSMGEKLYKGTDYDDTCITEIEFYYRGKKIEIINAVQLQNDYLARLKKNLTETISGHDYWFYVEHYRHVISFNKKGIVKYKYCIGDNDKKRFRLNDFLPYSQYKVDNLRLYMRKNSRSRWELARYQLYVGEKKIHGITIYKDINNDNSGLELSNADNIYEESKTW